MNHECPPADMPLNLSLRFEDSEGFAQFGATHAKLLCQFAFRRQSRILTEVNGTEPVPDCRNKLRSFHPVSIVLKLPGSTIMVADAKHKYERRKDRSSLFLEAL